MTRKQGAQIVNEYGPFEGAPHVGGVSYDGEHVWLAAGAALVALDPENGNIARRLEVTADAGTAFDGTHFYQLADARIQKIDARTGKVVGSIPAPGQGKDSGLTWAEGTLWVGQYRDRTIVQIDADSGKVLRTITSDRFVTGVTFVDGEMWHGTWEGEKSDLRRIDPESGEVLEQVEMPDGTGVSGLDSNGADLFFCGGGQSGKVRAVRRPRRG
jgi:glutamine cyclotransferase